MSIINRLIGRIFNKTVKRKQFNVTIDEGIIEVVHYFAEILEVPKYTICEHLLQVGYYHLMDILGDPEGRESLQEHLITAHLLGLKSDDGGLLGK
jgi:hypothetical protein